MSTTQPYYTTVLENGMPAVPLPEELRGQSVRITVENEPVKLSGQENTKISMNDFLKKYTGILKECDVEIHGDRMAGTNPRKGILGLRGILKGCTREDLENARHEYLMEKYAHG